MGAQGACLQNVEWQKQGLPDLSIAVNLTTRQFSDENLLHDLADILQETGMQPQLLELEITATLLIRDVDKTLRIMTGLKAMGFKLVVDDFGTCYVSLPTLRQFPLDSSKIDRSFVRDVTAGSDADPHSRWQHLAPSIIAMGHSLSVTVVAQGVETKARSTICAGTGATRCKASTSTSRWRARRSPSCCGTSSCRTSPSLHRWRNGVRPQPPTEKR